MTTSRKSKYSLTLLETIFKKLSLMGKSQNYEPQLIQSTKHALMLLNRENSIHELRILRNISNAQ